MKINHLLNAESQNMTSNIFQFLVSTSSSDEWVENLNNIQWILETIHNVNEIFNSKSRVFENTIEMNEANVLKVLVAMNFLDNIDKSSNNIGSNRFTGSCTIIENESLLFSTGFEHKSSKFFMSSLFYSHFWKTRYVMKIKMTINTYALFFEFDRQFLVHSNLWYDLFRVQLYRNRWSSCNTWQSCPCLWIMVVLL